MQASDGVHLLETEPGLIEDLSPAARADAARLVVVPGFDLPAGDFELREVRDSPDVAGEVWGLYVCSGYLLNQVRLHGRTCSRLFGPGDLMLLDGPLEESIPITISWRVRQDARVVALEDRLLSAGQRWPPLMRRIHERAAVVARQGLIDRAISQLPRVEDRLLACFWTFADRRGKVRGDGVWIELPLTHDELGELIGARRSTVSLGLRKLDDDGLVSSEGRGWLLAHASLKAFRRSQSGDAAL